MLLLIQLHMVPAVPTNTHVGTRVVEIVTKVLEDSEGNTCGRTERLRHPIWKGDQFKLIGKQHVVLVHH